MKGVPDYHNFNHLYQTEPLLSIRRPFQFFHKAIRISESPFSIIIIHYWDRNYWTKYFSISDLKACSSSNIQDSVDHTIAEGVNCLLNLFMESISNNNSYLFQLICPPPWPEAKEKSFAEQMNFLGLRLGGWAFNF